MLKETKKNNKELLSEILAYDFNPYEIEDKSFQGRSRLKKKGSSKKFLILTFK